MWTADRSPFDIVTSYVSFGLALYAAGALLALLKLHRVRAGMSEMVLSDFHWMYSCIVLVILDAIRQVWDAYHVQHFPIVITRALVPYAYLSIGNSLFRIAKRNSGKRKA